MVVPEPAESLDHHKSGYRCPGVQEDAPTLTDVEMVVGLQFVVSGLALGTYQGPKQLPTSKCA